MVFRDRLQFDQPRDAPDMIGKYEGFGTTQDGDGEYNRMRFLFKQMANGIATAVPVVVRAVNGRTVDVTPAVNQLDGGGKAVPHGTINDLPIWRPQGGGTAIILPVEVGDKGLAIFCHSDISSVKANEGKESNPGSRRKHDYADGVYLGGMFGDEEPEQYIKVSGAGIDLVAPTVTASENFSVGNGATGNFTDAFGQVVTVVDGIITGIV